MARAALLLALACAGCGSSRADLSVDAASEPPGEASIDAGARDARQVPDATRPGDAAPDATRSHDATLDGRSDAAATPCPAEMVHVAEFCVDRYEAYVAEVDDAGLEHPHSPYDTVDGLVVRAKSAAHVVPQGYISQVEATAACNEAGKRASVAPREFADFCRGGPDSGAYYPYGGTVDIPGYCNEGKGSYVELLFGSDPETWTYADFNDPELNQIEGVAWCDRQLSTLRLTVRRLRPHGQPARVGLDPADESGHGRFRGGFYGDAEENGPGCLYVTSAHELDYHDYSTGFRCCSGRDRRGRLSPNACSARPDSYPPSSLRKVMGYSTVTSPPLAGGGNVTLEERLPYAVDDVGVAEGAPVEHVDRLHDAAGLRVPHDVEGEHDRSTEARVVLDGVAVALAGEREEVVADALLDVLGLDRRRGIHRGMGGSRETAVPRGSIREDVRRSPLRSFHGGRRRVTDRLPDQRPQLVALGAVERLRPLGSPRGVVGALSLDCLGGCRERPWFAGWRRFRMQETDRWGRLRCGAPPDPRDDEATAREGGYDPSRLARHHRRP